MDDYFLSRDEYEVPLAEDGTPDLESPLCMDMELLNEHFTRLSAGETVQVPRFDFTTQTRSADPSLTLRLGKDEVAVFEGIHALNDEITLAHPEAFKLYISASADVVDDDGAAVMLFQPGNDDGCIQPAGIGKQYALEVLLSHDVPPVDRAAAKVSV